MAEKDLYNDGGNGFDLNQEGSHQGQTTEYNLADSHDQLERGLKSRHIQFLALGMCLFARQNGKQQ